jgi:aryl-alcohol dehydrogenase-like predicted oxidoreductase
VSTRLGLGTAQFGLRYGVANLSGQVSHSEAAAILEYAAKAGLAMLDTAIAYGDSEMRLGRLGITHWQVVSKLPALPPDCRDVGAWVRSAVDGSLARLAIPRLHGLLLHEPQELLAGHGDALWAALLELRERGKVAKIGISVYGPEDLQPLWGRFAPDIVQAPFNVIDRRIAASGWLRRLHEAGTEVHARSVFLQGLLLMAPARRPPGFARWQGLWDQWQGWLAQQRLTPLQACLRFALSRAEVDRVVVGVDSLAQLREVISAAAGEPLVPPENLASNDPDLINPSRWSLS